MSELQSIRKQIKDQIRADYLGGMDMKDITSKYGFQHARACYYHLSPLSEQDKLTRAISRAKVLQEELEERNEGHL